MRVGSGEWEVCPAACESRAGQQSSSARDVGRFGREAQQEGGSLGGSRCWG
jgi:hypothetical protein